MCCLPGLMLAVWPGLAAEREVLASDHYIIRHHPADHEAAIIVRDMGEQAFFRLASQIGHEPSAPIEIELCHNHGDLERAVGGRMGRWVLGVAFPGTSRLALKARVGRERLKRTLVHELSHVILGLRMAEAGATVPRWFDEGVAKYLSGEWRPSEEHLIVEAAIGEDLLSLEEIEADFPHHPDEASLAYAQSYGLVRYLAETRPEVDLTTVIDELAATGSLERAVRRTWGTDLATIEQQWQEVVRTVYVRRTAWLDVDGLIFAAMALLAVVAYIAGARRRARQSEAERETALPHRPRDTEPAEESVFTRQRRRRTARRDRRS